jgi:hypothetical protein
MSYLEAETEADEAGWLRRAAAEAMAAHREAEARIGRLVEERTALAGSEAELRREVARLGAALQARHWRARARRVWAVVRGRGADLGGSSRP